MFGISFGEFFIIFIVALIVIGPQKLPETIRTVGSIIGKLRSLADQVKNDVTKEFQVDDLKQSFMDTKNNFTQQLNSSTELDDVKKTLQEARKVTENSIRDSQKAIDHSINPKFDAVTHNTSYADHHEEHADTAHYIDTYYDHAEITEPPKNYQALLHTDHYLSEHPEFIETVCQARQFELFMINEDHQYLTYQLKYAKVRQLNALPNIIDRYHDTLVELNH